MSKDIIKLEIPAKSEFIPVARLTIAGISSRLDFNIEELEDLKVAVAEACINVLNQGTKENIYMEFEVSEDCICTRVKDVKEVEGTSLLEDLNLGMLIIESLMDEVEIKDWGLEMKKFVGVDANDIE